MEKQEFNKIYDSLIAQINKEKENKKSKQRKFRNIYITILIIIAIIAYIWMRSILASVAAILLSAFIFNPIMLYDLICHPNIKTPKQLQGFEEIYYQYSQINKIEIQKDRKIEQKQLNEELINIILNTINSDNEIKSIEGINSEEYEEAEITPVRDFSSEFYIQNKDEKIIMSEINNGIDGDPSADIYGCVFDRGTFIKIDIPYNFKEKTYLINRKTEEKLNDAHAFYSHRYKNINEESMLIKKNRKKSQCKSECIKNSIFNIYSSNVEYTEKFMNKEIISQLEKYYEICPFKITLKDNHIYITFEDIWLTAPQLVNKNNKKFEKYEKYEKDKINILYANYILVFGLANSLKCLFINNMEHQNENNI